MKTNLGFCDACECVHSATEDCEEDYFAGTSQTPDYSLRDQLLADYRYDES